MNKLDREGRHVTFDIPTEIERSIFEDVLDSTFQPEAFRYGMNDSIALVKIIKCAHASLMRPLTDKSR